MWTSIVGFASNIIAKIDIKFVLGAIAIGGWTAWWFEDEAHTKTTVDAAQKIERAHSNVSTLKQSLSDSEASVKRLQEANMQNEVLRRVWDIERASLIKELEEERAKYESYKPRWAKVANKRPTLLARLINSATIKRVRGFTAATCRADCDQDRNGGNHTPDTSATGSNTGS